jgi:hypothetical protein
MNVTFTHCEAYGCKNITSDLYKEKFGVYCFEHTSKCKPPFGNVVKNKNLSPISPRRIVVKESPVLVPKINKKLDFSPRNSKLSLISSPKKSKSLLLPLPGEESDIVNDLIPEAPEDKYESVHLPLPYEEKVPSIIPGIDLTFENYQSSPIVVESIKTPVLSPRRNSKFIKKIECCYCTDPYDISKVMNCGHMICPQCLEGIVRSPYCEFCDNLLEGPFLTEKLSMIINNRYKQDLENLANEEQFEESSEEESSDEE